MTETINLRVTRYRDASGEPTCIADAQAGDFCPFVMISGLGTREHCFWQDGCGKHRDQLQRRDNGAGTTIPHGSCPVWQSEETP